MSKQTFAVKNQTLEVNDKGVQQTKFVSLGEGLLWQEAVELRKQNPDSWTHPENLSYPNSAENLKFFAPVIAPKKVVVHKKRVRTN